MDCLREEIILVVEQIYGLILVEVTKSSALQDRIVLQLLRKYLAIVGNFLFSNLKIWSSMQ